MTSQDNPVEPGGIVRVPCDTTDNRRVTADIIAEQVTRLGCGCWEMRGVRPGPDMGPLTCRSIAVVFQRCGRIHDDGSQEDPPGTPHPAPIVIKRTAA